ncbi:MAG: MetS family NSS transporter small subunit [Candidatus Eisenbacteria bacterium]|nr:MetS family NSS transporter small subunit [Candidatus Eisenbacteria bacterium]
MPFSAWMMLIFGCVVLYGGLLLCLRIAHRNRGKRDVAGDDRTP